MRGSRVHPIRILVVSQTAQTSPSCRSPVQAHSCHCRVYKAGMRLGVRQRIEARCTTTIRCKMRASAKDCACDREQTQTPWSIREGDSKISEHSRSSKAGLYTSNVWFAATLTRTTERWGHEDGGVVDEDPGCGLRRRRSRSLFSDCGQAPSSYRVHSTAMCALWKLKGREGVNPKDPR